MHEYLGGSQLIIEMFNQNEEAMFSSGLLYLSRTLEQDSISALQKDQNKVLKNYFNLCKYPLLEDYYEISNEFKETEEYTQACNRGHTCLTAESASMQALYRFSDDEMPKEFNDLCNKMPLTVASTIRLEKVSRLQENFNGDQDFHAIYIFRDPRGIFAARNKQWEVDDSEIEYLCQSIKENLKYIEQERSSTSWAGQHILPLRYEEVELYPEQFIPKIFNSLGTGAGVEKIKQGFHDYFSNLDNTNRINDVMSGTFEWKDMPEMQKSSKGNAGYKRVQNICGEGIFKKLGYQYIRDDNHMENIKNKQYGNDDSGFSLNADDWILLKDWCFAF